MARRRIHHQIKRSAEDGRADRKDAVETTEPKAPVAEEKTTKTKPNSKRGGK